MCLSLFVLGACARQPSTHAGAGASDDVRIVSLSPAAADIVRALGLSDEIVGRNSADAWTHSDVPTCGELGRIDYEALLAAKPTIVLVQEPSMPVRLQALAQQHGFRALNLSLLTLDDIRTSARQIGDALPAARRGPARDELRRVEHAMDAAWSTADGIYPGRVLLLASVDPPAALGPGSFHAQIVQRLGGTLIPAKGPPYITLAAEDIVALAPDGIILILPRDPTAPETSEDSGGRDTTAGDAGRATQAMRSLGTLNVPAIRVGRVALIDDPKAHLPSTAMITLAEEIRNVLQRWNVDGH